MGFLLFLAAIIAGLLACLKALSPAENTEDRITRAVFVGAFMTLAAIGLFDHYPYTLLSFQTLWWGCLAAAMTQSTATSGSSEQLPAASTTSDRTHMPSTNFHQVKPSSPSARASGLAD